MTETYSFALYLPDWRNLLTIALLASAAILVGTGLHWVVFATVRRATRGHYGLLAYLIRFAATPTRAIFPALALVAAVPWLQIAPATLAILLRVLELALIAGLGWLAVACINAFQEFIGHKYTIDATDNLAARTMRTEVQVIRHIAVAIVIIVTIAIMLMTFPNIRHLGESLFASAGLAALVAGLAARTTLTSLLAGVQIALTQPFRIEDVVIVEGEWGWIEEITTTYVVVRVWDLRRLVVPLSYFIEKPFQNWTRRTADLLGTVFVYTDYSVPVEQIRHELHDILKRSGMWDGHAWGLQVTNASERTIELRALMSAPNGPQAWDLRCYVREKLIDFLQKEYPLSLPRVRADLNPSSNGNQLHGNTQTEEREGDAAKSSALHRSR